MPSNNLTNLALALTATEAGVASASATPAMDDSTTKLATTASLFQQFTGTGKQLLAATSGYQKFPGGLIVQWGQTITSASAGVAVVFPIAFPNGLRAVTMSPLQGSNVSATYDSITNAGMTINGWNPATGARVSFNAVGWIALGH